MDNPANLLLLKSGGVVVHAAASLQRIPCSSLINHPHAVSHAALIQHRSGLGLAAVGILARLYAINMRPHPDWRSALVRTWSGHPYCWPV